MIQTAVKNVPVGAVVQTNAGVELEVLEQRSTTTVVLNRVTNNRLEIPHDYVVFWEGDSKDSSTDVQPTIVGDKEVEIPLEKSGSPGDAPQDSSQTVSVTVDEKGEPQKVDMPTGDGSQKSKSAPRQRRKFPLSLDEVCKIVQESIGDSPEVPLKNATRALKQLVGDSFAYAHCRLKIVSAVKKLGFSIEKKGNITYIKK